MTFFPRGFSLFSRVFIHGLLVLVVSLATFLGAAKLLVKPAIDQHFLEFGRWMAPYVCDQLLADGPVRLPPSARATAYETSGKLLRSTIHPPMPPLSSAQLAELRRARRSAIPEGRVRRKDDMTTRGATLGTVAPRLFGLSAGRLAGCAAGSCVCFRRLGERGGLPSAFDRGDRLVSADRRAARDLRAGRRGTRYTPAFRHRRLRTLVRGGVGAECKASQPGGGLWSHLGGAREGRGGAATERPAERCGPEHLGGIDASYIWVGTLRP